MNPNIHSLGEEEFRAVNRGERHITIHFDGAYRYSYGKHEYGCGWVISQNGVDIVSKSFGGISEEPFSSNASEYLALKDALEYLIISEYFEFDRLTIVGDSRLVINQISDKWKMNEGIYVKIGREVKNYIYLHFHRNVDYKWISRNFNQKADELSKIGLNNYNEAKTKNA